LLCQVSISHGQMELLKTVGGELGRAGTRQTYAHCNRPSDMKLLPSTAPTEKGSPKRVGGGRPPTAAAAAWWAYAKRCVLKEHTKTKWVRVTQRAKLLEEYYGLLEQATPVTCFGLA
jgi:hypothetical protein